MLTERKQKSPVTFFSEEREFMFKLSSWVGQWPASVESQNCFQHTKVKTVAEVKINIYDE